GEALVSGIRRRDFVILLGCGTAAAWPLAVRAQQSTMALVGLLSGAQRDDREISAVRQGLKDAGYIEGRNLAIKYRSADGRFDRLPALAADLVADPVAAIIALAPPAAVAAKAATATIPIIFTTGTDPVDLGLVSSCNRPGGNVTGVNFLVTALAAKRLELLHELLPSAMVVGFLTTPTNPASESETRDLQAAARNFGLLHLCDGDAFRTVARRDQEQIHGVDRNLLRRGVSSSLIEHVRSSSSRKHVYQHRQNDEHEDGGEQDASDNDQSERALNLCADRR